MYHACVVCLRAQILSSSVVNKRIQQEPRKLPGVLRHLAGQEAGLLQAVLGESVAIGERPSWRERPS